jgi:hypothetical protein
VRDVRWERQLWRADSESLIRPLADGSDWDGLWRLVRDLPLASAVLAARHFRDGWHPAGQGERTLFDRLVHADPERLAHAGEALMASAVIRVKFSHPSLTGHGAVSADGRLLALVRRAPGHGGTISVSELPSGGTADPERHGSMRIEGTVIEPVLDRVRLTFAGDALIVASVHGRVGNQGGTVLLRYTEGRVRSLDSLRIALRGSLVWDVAPCFTPAGGFALLCDGFVAFCDGDGTLAGKLPLSPSLALPSMTGAAWLDTEPGGRVAVAGYLPVPGTRSGWAVYDAGTGRVVASAPCPGLSGGIRFCGPGRLITTSWSRGDGGRVRLWRLDDPQPWPSATARFPRAGGPVVIPGRGQIAVSSDGHVRFLDADTLQPASAPEGFLSADEGVRTLRNSAGDTACAFAGAGFADVFPGRSSLFAVAGKPPCDWMPEDLGTVSAVLSNPAAGVASRPLLELMQAALECRFGGDRPC